MLVLDRQPLIRPPLSTVRLPALRMPQQISTRRTMNMLVFGSPAPDPPTSIDSASSSTEDAAADLNSENNAHACVGSSAPDLPTSIGNASSSTEDAATDLNSENNVDPYIEDTISANSRAEVSNHIMADRGFKLEPHLEAQGINMNTPAFTMGPLPDFVICRSSVAKLLRTPFSEEAWQFMACRFRGVVHLQHRLTQKVREDRYRSMTDRRDDLRSYWGLKFPEHMASSDPGTTPDVQAVLNEMEEYKVVVRNSLGSHTLLMGATMKAVDPRYEPGSTKGYVVFRTNRVLSTDRQWFFFRRKLLEWWSYSVPIGVPRVICGFRDDYGIVQTVEEFQVHQLPEKAKGMWSEDVCLRFFDQFLRFLKENVREDDGRTVYHFEHQPLLRKIICTRLPDTEECAIVPGWYLQMFNPTV
ncbi:hypothetical protein MTO96_025637 [Rhipicephalus appendiculatus]